MARANVFAELFRQRPANHWFAYEVAKQLLDAGVLDVETEYWRLVGFSPSSREAWAEFVEATDYRRREAGSA